MESEKTLNRKKESIFHSSYNLLFFLSVLATFGVWIAVRVSKEQNGTINYVWALMLAVIPFLASFKGFKASKEWGGLRSVLGRSIAALALGLLLWSIGEFIWSYYNLFLKVSAPYPSWADAGYTAGVTFWIISTLFLAKLTGVGLYLKRKPILRVVVAIVIALSLVLSYYLVVTVARKGQITSGGGSLKTFFDIFYPLTDVISLTIISVVAAISGRYLGGILRIPILFVFGGLLASFIFDLTFSYTTTVGTYYNGKAIDLFLFAAVTLLSLAVLLYAQKAKLLSHKDKVAQV
jgi:hypothetical protein